MAAIKIQGLDRLIKRIDDYPLAVQKAVDKELNAGAVKIRDLATSFAPVDDGQLIRGIGVKHETFKHTVYSLAYYSPYIEWGTGRKVKVTGDSERKAYAQTFKGKSGRPGDFNDFVQAIMAWAGRKGIGGTQLASGRTSQSATSLGGIQQAAYWIALYIIRNGIRPQPFFFRAYDAVKVEILRNVRKAITKA